MHVDLQTLSLSEGGYLLVKRALSQVGSGGYVTVSGTDPALEIDLRAWCRTEGHSIEWQEPSEPGATCARVVNRGAQAARWLGAQRASGMLSSDDVADRAPRTWGLAARGAYVESGTPEFDFELIEKVDVWSDDAAAIYRQ